ANTVRSRIDNAGFGREEERNAVLGSAYFHRAYRHYNLTHRLGAVPYLDWALDAPKQDVYSYAGGGILARMRKDMEVAYQWVPEVVDRGRTSKAACGVLLMKVCMVLGDFDRAIQVGQEIVAKHPLMRNRFTPNQGKPNTNLMFDLHSVEAKLDMSNTEGLMYVVAYPEEEGSDRIQTMPNAVPFWNSGNIKTPDGQGGTSIAPAAGETDPEMDLNKPDGRGIGRLRSTSYFTSYIWRADKEANDMRGIYNRDTWKRMEDLRYNAPGLKTRGNPWYGKHFEKPAGMSVEDTIRTWYPWPHFKVFVPDPLQTTWAGGETPWYIYRSAEVYLLIAECYYWKDQPGLAAEALNEVRTRAGAAPLNAGDINIGEILDERARELYYEENRHVELVRISYIYARTGKPCEIFGGRTYSLQNLNGPGGTGSNIKQEGIN